MPARREVDDAPEPFRRALAALRSAPVRSEVVLDEAPAPQRLAPWAVALTADVVVGEEEIATGRLVLLHDPAGQTAWEGVFRLVTFVRAELEPEIAADPMLPGVGWAWLLEALQSRGAAFHAPSGTVTRVASESFGTMAERSPTAEVEMRASWTPDSPEVAEHLTAWCELLCTVAGLPPVPPGVLLLPQRRPSRQGCAQHRSPLA
jgi:Protein of unknown function (DUF3000)